MIKGRSAGKLVNGEATDIVGYRIGNEIVCLKCVREDEVHDLEPDEIICISQDSV